MTNKNSAFIKAWEMVRKSRNFLGALLCAISLIIGAMPTETPADPVSALTLGVALNALMDKLDQMISDARNAVNASGMEVGRQVEIEIGSMKNAYPVRDRTTASMTGGQTPFPRIFILSRLDPTGRR